MEIDRKKGWRGWRRGGWVQEGEEADHHGVEHVRRHEDGHLVGRIVVDVKEELEEDVGVIGLRLLGNYFGVDDGPHHGQQGGDGLWAVDGHWAAAKS